MQQRILRYVATNPSLFTTSKHLDPTYISPLVKENNFTLWIWFPHHLLATAAHCSMRT